MHDFDAEAMKCCCSGSKALFVLPLPQALSLPPNDGVAVLPIVREVAYAREGRKKKGEVPYLFEYKVRFFSKIPSLKVTPLLVFKVQCGCVLRVCGVGGACLAFCR